MASDRQWWLRERHALGLDLFRVCAGAALVVHFASGFQEFPRLLAQDGMLGSSALWQGRWLSSLGYVELRAFFGAAVGLAGCVALGVFPRACAAMLLVASACIYRAAARVSHLDDFVAALTVFWLTLLPVGETLTVRGVGALRSWRSVRVPGFTVNAFLIQVLLLHLDVGSLRNESLEWPVPSWITLALCAVPACFATATVATYTAGMVISVFVHLYLWHVTGSGVAHFILISSNLLLWGERPALPGRTTRFEPIDWRTVAGALSIAVLAAFRIDGVLGFTSAERATARVLADVGLLPVGSGTTVPSGAPLEAWMEDDRTLVGLGFDFRGDRAQLVLAHLADTAKPSGDTLVLDVAREMASAYCRAHAANAPRYLGVGNSAARRRVAWFDCGSTGAPSVVLLREAPSTVSRGPHPDVARGTTEDRGPG